jgi:hypothetical protein
MGARSWSPSPTATVRTPSRGSMCCATYGGVGWPPRSSRSVTGRSGSGPRSSRSSPPPAPNVAGCTSPRMFLRRCPTRRRRLNVPTPRLTQVVLPWARLLEDADVPDMIWREGLTRRALDSGCSTGILVCYGVRGSRDRRSRVVAAILDDRGMHRYATRSRLRIGKRGGVEGRC